MVKILFFSPDHSFYQRFFFDLITLPGKFGAVLKFFLKSYYQMLLKNREKYNPFHEIEFLIFGLKSGLTIFDDFKLILTNNCLFCRDSASKFLDIRLNC
jgi:hypothetical protein